MNVNLIAPKRACIYTRVSSDEQVDGYSLDEQLAICTQFAKSRGWDIVAVFRDDGYSAKTTDRPDFQNMLFAAETGAFDVIVVHKLDRFSRSIVDVLVTLRELEKGGIVFASAAEVFDFSTPWGMVILVIIAAFAEWYIANLSEETKKGKLGRAKDGEWGGRVPFGYTAHYKVHGGDSRAVPDPHDRYGYRLALDLARSGRYSLNAIVREMNAQGYRPTGRAGEKKSLKLWTRDSVAAMLRNRFYLGEIVHQGVAYAGKHEPLCSVEEWEEAQRALAERRTHDNGVNRNTRVYMFSNLVRCAICASPMRGTYSVNRRGGKYIEYRYYRCSAKEHHIACTQTMVRADAYEELVGEWLSAVSVPDNWYDLLVPKLAEKPAHRAAAPSLQQLRLTLERTTELYRLGELDRARYQQERTLLRAQISAAEAVAAPPVAMQRAADFLKNIPVLWQVATPEERRDWIHAIAAEVVLGQDAVTLHIKPHLQPIFFATGVLTAMDVVGFEPTLDAF